MLRKVIFFACVLLIFMGCSTKLDLNAPYKDIPVVYGLLDPNNTAQYIRVQKAFLSTKDASEAAQKNDSIYYPSGVIDVQIKDLTVHSSFSFIETNLPKEDGYFSNDTNRVFKTNHPINPDHTYQLLVTNNETGKEITAQTDIVHDVTLQQNNLPVFPLAGYTLGQPIKYYPRDVKINFGDNGFRTACFLRFVWFDVMNNNDTIKRHLDVNLGKINVESSKHSVSFNTELIFKKLKENIPADPNVKKRLLSYNLQNPLGGIKFVFYTASEDLRTYIKLNEPGGSGLFQSKPEFTNLTGDAVGLFSSRNTTVTALKTLTQESVQALQNSSYTSNLKFSIP